MTPQQKAQQLAAEGVSYYAIAKRLGQPIHRIRRWTVQPPDADTARLLEDANGTRTVPELAERWGLSDADVLRELARLRSLGHDAKASKRTTSTERARAKYAHLALDVRPDSTVPELAELWGVTRNAAASLLMQMRKAGLDVPRLSSSVKKPSGPDVPRPWLADCDGTRTIGDLALLWGLSYDTAFARIDKARRVGVVVPLRTAERPKPPGRPSKPPAEPKPDFAADVTPGRTVDDLAALWGINLAGAIGRCAHLARTGRILVVPSKAPRVVAPPKPKPQRPPKPAAAPNPIADYGVWMAALDGTKTALQVCEAWGVTYDTFIRRIRRLRDAGLYPEWVTPPRERAERKRPAPLPPLWPVGSSPAVEPAPIEEPEHPKPAPYVGLALPPSRWCAAGVCSVLGMTWAVFDVAVQAGFGWTLQPHTLLEDADAAAVLSTFGVAVRSAA